MSAPVITIRDLDFAYDGRATNLALCGINIDIAVGSTLGLIGPNGGGKTTLVRLLLGLLRPQRGEIRIGGLTPRQAVARGDLIGYLPQNPPAATHISISVRQLVRLGLAGKTGIFRAHAPADVAFVDQLIERCELSSFADKPVSELSGGELQRTLIARAVAPRPRILILDEPTTGVDARGQQTFIELIQQLKTELGLTIIFVSHDLRAVTSISDRVACLSQHLHYHDTPRHMPAELVYKMFSCNLAAMGLGQPAVEHACAVHPVVDVFAADERR